MITPDLAGGRYRIAEAIGAGGMATVYLGEDRRLRRPVAIKVLADNLAVDPDFRERFEREARVAARLAHPNVVHVFDVGEADGRPYIVMELVDGPTLAEELRRRGPLPATEVADIARQVCAGLEHAHRAGLVHRDVKPGNLLRAADGTVKIADFGIARAADAAHLTRTGGVVGTAAYLSPEQAAGLAVTAGADLYSLGVVLHELLTGGRPQPGASGAGGRETPPGAPAALGAAIAHCLAARPEDRPLSAAALAAELAGAPGETGGGVTGGAPTLETPAAAGHADAPADQTVVLPVGGSGTGGGGTQVDEAAPDSTQVIERVEPMPVAAGEIAGPPRRKVPGGALAVGGLALALALALGAVLTNRGRDAGTSSGGGTSTTSATPGTTRPASATTQRTTTVAAPATPAATAGCARQGQNMSGRVLVGFDFSNADLSCADFSGSALAGANFRNADLRGANLSGATLAGVSFRNADLTGANLSGATPVGVDWKGARCPDGRDAEGEGCVAG